MIRGEVQPSPTSAFQSGSPRSHLPSIEPEDSGIEPFRAIPRECGQSAAVDNAVKSKRQMPDNFVTNKDSVRIFACCI